MLTIHDVQEVGAVVRQERRRQKLRQEELAELVGCGPRFIGELERGKETLQWAKVFRVLQGLGIRVQLETPEE